MSAPFASQGPARAASSNPGADAVKLLNALPHPVVAVLPDGSIANANPAATNMAQQTAKCLMLRLIISTFVAKVYQEKSNQ